MISLRRPIKRRRGTILIIVMWIALGLVSVALYFSQSARLAYLAADNVLAGLQAEHAIDGAQRYIAYALQTYLESGELPDTANADYNAEAVAVGNATFWIIGRDRDRDAYGTAPVFGLVDEASKLNVNTATLEMLAALPNMTLDLAAAIIDWRDFDSEITSGGAEAQDYLMLDPPYIAKDSEFESIEELRLVQGIDLAILYGEDFNRNGVLDPNENDGDQSWPPDNADGRLDPGLAEYLTAHTRESNLREDGSQRINIRGQSARQDVTQLFEESFGQERAAEILNALPNNMNSITSPLALYMDSGMTAAEFAAVADELTMRDGDYLVGLVNVNTAPAAVLACLPSMTEGMAEQLVASRTGLDSIALSSVAWVATVLDPEVARDIGPYITARSHQFSLDVAAVGNGGRGYRRVWMVLDYEDEVRVIYRRDMTRAGWALGTNLRDSLDARP